MNNIQRPALDRSLYEPSHLWALAHFVYALALFFVPGYVSYQVALAELSLWVQVPAIALLTILAGYGLPSTVRQRRGIDIAAGCGQLATARR